MKKAIFWACFTVVAGLCASNLIQYQIEYEWIRAKALAIVMEAGAAAPKEQVLALRDYVRQHVSYSGAPTLDRPYLRDSARQILESGKGYCGESTRAFVCLARSLGIQAQRINLYAIKNESHVLAEVRLGPSGQFLVDPQVNQYNPMIDPRQRTVVELLVGPEPYFADYSTVHVRRIPVLGQIVQRLKLQQSRLSWVLENPFLIKAILWGLLAAAMVLVFAADRVLLRLYARRLGLHKRNRVVSSPPGLALKTLFPATS